MGAGGAVNIIHRNEIRSSDDPEATRAELISDYEQRLMNPYAAAARGMIDDVIDPLETPGPKIIASLGDAREQARTAPSEEAREHSALTSVTLNGPNGVNSEVVAAAIAAVQAYLESEVQGSQGSTRRGVSSWRMALVGRPAERGFSANVSWRGRD